jgi:hypothetical protein
VKNIPFYIISEKLLSRRARDRKIRSVCIRLFRWISIDILMWLSSRSISKRENIFFIEKNHLGGEASKAIKCREWPVLWRARKISFKPGAKHLYLSSHDLNTSRAEGRKEISPPRHRHTSITGHNTSNQITMKFTRTIERMLIQSGLQFFTFMILAGMWFLCWPRNLACIIIHGLSTPFCLFMTHTEHSTLRVTCWLCHYDCYGPADIIES